MASTTGRWFRFSGAVLMALVTVVACSSTPDEGAGSGSPERAPTNACITSAPVEGKSVVRANVATERASLDIEETTLTMAKGVDVVIKTMTIKVGGTLFMRVKTTKVPDKGATSHVNFGPIYGGLKQADLVSDGLTLNGTFDGRAILPLPLKGDHRDLAFADGQPPPAASLDENVISAVQELLQAGHDRPPSCNAAPFSTSPPLQLEDFSTGGQAGHSDATGSTFECTVCQAACISGAVVCGVGGAIACSAFLTIPFFGEAIFAICVVINEIICLIGEAVCLDLCTARGGSTCCPIACGVGCCSGEDKCLSPGAGTCCFPGTEPCKATTCCAETDICMQDSRCCPNSPDSQHKECPGPNDSCCNLSDSCLTSGACCSNVTCNDNSVCCGPKQGCFEPSNDKPQECLQCDATTDGLPCNKRCCIASTETCTSFNNSECCRNEAVCRPNGGDVECCPTGNDCVHKPPFPLGDTCCPSAKACQNPPTCCLDSTSCIKNPPDGQQFCCPDEAVCGSSACCVNRAQPCTQGFPTRNDECCRTNVCNRTDTHGNVIQKQCCDLGTSCMIFRDGHQQCCEPDWVCGNLCCNASDGMICVHGGPPQFLAECVPQ